MDRTPGGTRRRIVHGDRWSTARSACSTSPPLSSLGISEMARPPERSERIQDPAEAVADVVAASCVGSHHRQHAERLVAHAERSERPERFGVALSLAWSRLASSTMGWSSWSAK